MSEDPMDHWPAWAPAFLEHYAVLGIVSLAARAVEVTPGAVYALRARDAEFAFAYDEAAEAAADVMEAEARRRAVAGVDEPVWHQGVMVGTQKRYSDSLLQFLLKGRRRKVFGDKQEITGADGAPLVPELDEDERARRVARLVALAQSRRDLVE